MEISSEKWRIVAVQAIHIHGSVLLFLLFGILFKYQMMRYDITFKIDY
jgi:membrane protein YdbS with pleckstrin-like domain